MEGKRLLSISASVLAAAWITSDAGLILAQTSGEKKSFGGTQSERTPDSGTPLPEKSPMTGSGEKGTGSTKGSVSKGGRGTSQSGMKDGKTIHPDVNQSVGGSKSERTPETGTPLPEKSPMTGTVEKGSGSTKGSGSSGTTKGSRSTGTSKGTSQSRTKDGKTINPDLNPSVGGSQSERTGNDSGTPLPKNSPSTGTVEKGTGSSR